MIKPRNRIGFMLMMLIAVSVAAGCQSTDKGNGAGPLPTEASANSPKGDIPETTPPSGTDETSGHTDGSAGNGSAADTQEDPAAEPDVDLSDVTAVRLVNHNSGWIGGEGWIAFSDDGGTEWEVQAQPKGTVRQIFALNGKEAWTVMENNDLYRTTDGGETWNRIGSTPNAGFLHFISPETGFSGQAKTEDGGKTWSIQDMPDTTTRGHDQGAATDGVVQHFKNDGVKPGKLYVINETKTHN
ncbi:WD40/YVTN/BNR-like repeat-containing protein [Paenibacillus lautus]|nr:YCF48-related protein [Paenibacillus lautus]